jgi:hypothetical protein
MACKVLRFASTALTRGLRTLTPSPRSRSNGNYVIAFTKAVSETTDARDVCSGAAQTFAGSRHGGGCSSDAASVTHGAHVEVLDRAGRQERVDQLLVRGDSAAASLERARVSSTGFCTTLMADSNSTAFDPLTTIPRGAIFSLIRRCSMHQPPLSVTDAEQPLTVASRATTNSYPAACRGNRSAMRTPITQRPAADRS